MAAIINSPRNINATATMVDGRLVAEESEEKDVCDPTHTVYNRVYKFD